MSYATRLVFVLTSLSSCRDEVRSRLEKLLDERKESLESIVLEFFATELTPTTTFEFEQKIGEEVRELARRLAADVYNLLESNDFNDAPHDVTYQGGGYRRLNHKTTNRHVSTLFGTIELERRGYRYWHRDGNEKTIFPLEIQLGLVHGATPALAEAASRYMADTGATQAAVLARLKQQHGVRWGAERLRKVTQEMAQAMERFRQESQVLRILELLEQARNSRGKCKPVLSVGRDGISLCEYHYRCFEVATSGTVTVYDRAGKRLGSVYLGFPPELGQEEMTRELTALVEEVLRRWQGPLPRLAYVTDAGENETGYYRRVLRSMRHPRTGERLHWHRIVDYYHASERIWTMAHALFGRNEMKARAWALRMCKLLKKPNGPSRVLHSAAAFRTRVSMSATRADEYRKASNYIRRRTKFMQYAEYKRMHLPIGSGVTEAACKTIFTQRLKLSGMRWTNNGARTILTLRVIKLSRIWDAVHAKLLDAKGSGEIRVYEPTRASQLQNAA